jgi:gliding motility-associated protein GldE
LDPSYLLFVILFFLLIILSAFFSGSETAFFSLTKSVINQFKKSKSKSKNKVADLLQDSKKLLISIIIGNTIVNVSIATLAAIYTTKLSHQINLNEILILLIDVVVITFVILFFSEIIPKIIAAKTTKKLAPRIVYPLSMFYYLFYPLSVLLEKITGIISSWLGIDKDKHYLSEEELRTLVEVGEEKGALLKDEKEMISSIFEMGETTAKEIMVPRTDMVCIDKNTTINQVMSLIKEKLHSRIPVYQESVDNILGILYVKDLLPLIKKRNFSEFDVTKYVRPPYYVPEQKKINELLREYQTEKIHMAIVVDEYGGTSGIVTLEDVIEEIVGEIQDEHDFEVPLYQKINEDTFVVNASMPLEEINEELNLELPTEEGVETLAGFLLGQFGNVPKSKETITWNGYEFLIEKSTKKRIHQVRIIKKKSN